MQFYYNSGIPQRPRRARDGRATSSVNRDVPSFLQYPDGSHALGVISPSAAGSGRVADDEAGTAAQSGSIMGSFIVWADPTPPAAAGNRLHPKGLFFGLLMIDLVVCVLMLPGAAEALRTSSNRAGPSPSPDMSPYVMFFTGLFFKLVGAWGVHSHRIRWLSVFIAATLLLTILALLWTSSVLHFASLLLDVFLVLVSVQHRSSLMGSWFTASR